ncbi:MAG: hypothetical protein IJ914_01715, partial [Prevotella sp.]|nr:hypothetical protein [Prevotella sp.]
MKKVVSLFVMIAALLSSPQQVKADRIKESYYYKVVEDETGADHFTAKILMADLLYGDTYVKEGKLVAYERDYRKGKRIEICELHTWDQDGNDQSVHFIKGRNLMEGACIFISNAFNQMLQAEEKDYVINKKSNFDLPQVFLEVYWGPEMTNREWFIYFEFKDEDDDEHSHRMGSVNCGEYVNMGRNVLKVNQYKIERTGPLKFRFTTPPLPDNNCRDELKSYQQHQAWYILKSTYTLQDNKTVISKRDSVACLPSAEVPHMLNIPASAGNFKRMHLELEVHDAYKSVKDGFKDAKNKGYFYDNVISITPTTKLLSVPYPSDVTGKYDQYGRKIELSWTGLDKSSTESNDNGYFKETKPYIYRIETNAAGTVLNGAKWVYRGMLSTHATEGTMNFTDNEGIQYNRYYKYMVVNIPDVWAQELNPTNIKEDVLNVLGSSIMNNAISTKPTMSFKSLIQDKTEKTKVKLKWQYDRVPTTSGTVHFSVLRANTGKNNWAEIGTVGATSNPSPDFFATFTDEAVENIDTRHEYKVKLTLQDGNEWESDIINAGLLAGTSIDTLIASQGNYEHSVMLRWTAKQSGTEDTRYRVLRRIAGGDNEAYNVIYTTSGTSSTYIFEDRTVSPGFLYDYLLQAYHGELSDDKKPMSEFTAVGFCQTTGIITGRVSFKNGDNGVENVRVTLDAQDNNASSKQVVGPSNGIVWKADRIATANMFRKANTVQMLVRPESSMTKGVLASVPGMGHFLLEKDADAADSKTFRLQMKSEHANTYKVATCYTEKPLVRAVLAHYNYYQHTTSSAYIDGHTYTVYNYDDIMNDYWDLTRQWKEEGFTEVFQFDTYGLGHGEIAIVFFVKKQPVTDHSLIKSYHTMHGREKYDLGITLPADEFSLLNLMKDDQGHLTVKVGEQTSTSKTSVGVESTFGSSEETTALNRVPFDVDPASLIDEAYLKSDDGTVLLDQWRNLEKVLATEVVSIPEGNGVYDDFSLPFAVGGSYDVTTETAFYGNLSEVRVWDHVLSTQEETDNNDRILSGSEQGLRIYWPLSEFSDQIALDASCTNDVPNVRNGSVGTNIKVSPLAPEAAKMSRYVLTNARGEYTIRNVPFAGTDTRYTVTPSYGIHAFSPASRSAVISASSLVFGNYNFNDMSSFIVTGKVTYKNTNIPVDSVMFKVDGQVMTDAHGIIYSNSEGKYRISVSNGNHRIEAYRDGHLLSAFPMEKENTYEFRKDETVDFIDSTLVNVTGRINGGFTDKDEPLGFGRSKNRIGQ